MSSTADHRISLTLYRMLITLGVIYIVGIASAGISLMSESLGPSEVLPHWLMIAVSGLYVVALLMLIVRRQRFVRLKDEKAWPWWKAAAVNVSLIALVAIVLTVVL